MNGQEALEEGKFPTWVTPLRKKKLHLTKMTEKSLSIPHGTNYWSGFVVAYLPSEIRFWATKAIYLNSGGASEMLTTRAPTTWSVSQYEISYLILFWWNVYLLSFQSSHLTWAFTLLLYSSSIESDVEDPNFYSCSYGIFGVWNALSAGSYVLHKKCVWSWAVFWVNCRGWGLI